MTPTVRKAVALVECIDPNARIAIEHKGKRFQMHRPRRLVWAILREQGWSLPKIAKHSGGYHHTTVLHGLKRLETDDRTWAAHVAGRVAA